MPMSLPDQEVGPCSSAAKSCTAARSPLTMAPLRMARLRPSVALTIPPPLSSSGCAPPSTPSPSSLGGGACEDAAIRFSARAPSSVKSGLASSLGWQLNPSSFFRFTAATLALPASAAASAPSPPWSFLPRRSSGRKSEPPPPDASNEAPFLPFDAGAVLASLGNPGDSSLPACQVTRSPSADTSKDARLFFKRSTSAFHARGSGPSASSSSSSSSPASPAPVSPPRWPFRDPGADELRRVVDAPFFARFSSMAFLAARAAASASLRSSIFFLLSS
mmetsp:Transcript_43693/g.98788  ORF Transcript_43693/g.98788 Transcript_43693/m.98788 type:complete len:276 (-) Transcript_43693:53-880(-)